MMKPGVEGIVTYVQLKASLLPATPAPVIENVVGPSGKGTKPPSPTVPPSGELAPPFVGCDDDEHAIAVTESAKPNASDREDDRPRDEEDLMARRMPRRRERASSPLRVSIARDARPTTRAVARFYSRGDTRREAPS